MQFLIINMIKDRKVTAVATKILDAQQLFKKINARQISIRTKKITIVSFNLTIKGISNLR